MVSALYKASADGDAEQVTQLLADASAVDIELKDHMGVTPLIQAVRNGHPEVVKLLLDAGADPNSASSVGRPDNYTADPAILEMLASAAAKRVPPQVPGPPPVPAPYMQYPDGAYGYYPAQPVAYGAPQPYPPQFAPDGTPTGGPPHQPPMQYYAPPPPQMSPQGPPPHALHPDGVHNSGNNSLPPAHVSRQILCRYFPSCKYGASCMFLHPQTPFFPGPMPPPAHYPQLPQFDPNMPQQQHHQQPMQQHQQVHQLPHMPQGQSQPYPYPPPHAAYYPPHPHFPSHPASPHHSRGPSEIVISPVPVVQPLPPPGMMPYGMPAQMSPYGQPIPMPPHMASPHMAGSPTMYPSSVPMVAQPLPPMSPYHVRRDSISAHGQEYMGSPLIHTNGLPTSPRQVQSSIDGQFSPGASHHVRDGSRSRGARASIGGGPRSGKPLPPCLFFPSGRCRNGEHCRFPHVVPEENNGAPNSPPLRVNPKPRSSLSGIEAKFATLAVGEPNGYAGSSNHVSKANGVPLSRRDQAAMAVTNGFQQPRKSQSPPKVTIPAAPPQRVPVAEDFPVLGGVRTPPVQHQNGVAHVNGGGPTAAEVVRAAAAQKAVEPAKSAVETTALDAAPAEVPVAA